LDWSGRAQSIGWPARREAKKLVAMKGVCGTSSVNDIIAMSSIGKSRNAPLIARDCHSVDIFSIVSI
jgi:hypothetical protein